MKTGKYPWDQIDSNTKNKDYTARKVDQKENPKSKNLYWAVSPTGNPALLIDYTQAEASWRHIPGFAKIAVYDSDPSEPTLHTLTIELEDRSDIDMFHTLCLDIIALLQESPDKLIKHDSLTRLECWRLFLRRDKGVLSEEEQKGLIAELMFLSEYGFTTFSQEDAIAGWEGPNGGNQDFTYGQTGIEVKSKRKSTSSLIRISSENQLARNDEEFLFLQVVEINSETSDKGFTLQEVVDNTKSQIETPLLLDEFNKRLASAGYMGNEHYDKRWSKGKAYFYAVREGFPKIDASALIHGVEKVSYSIDLNCCDDFLLKESEFRDSLGSK